MIRLIGYLVGALPALAVAQGTISLSFPGQTTTTSATRLVSASECNVTIAVEWQVGLSSTPCSNFQVWISEGATCADAPGGTDLVIEDVTSSGVVSRTTGTAQFAIASLPAFGASTGVACATSQLEKDFLVCGALRFAQFGFDCSSTNQLTVKAGTSPKISFDSLPPQVPTLTSVVSLDSALSASYEVGSDTNVVSLLVREDATGVEVTRVEAVPSEGQQRIEGLANDVTYRISAQAVDEVGNLSTESASLTGTPRRTEGFWGIYRGSGGSEQGGCSASGGGVCFGLGLWVLTRMAARRRRT